MQILIHILDYCEDIDSALNDFNCAYETFFNSKVFQRAIAFNILQIGELVGKLSQEIRTETVTEMNWPAIKSMRNIVVHDYGNVDLDVVWNTAIHDVPELKAFCEKQLAEAST